MTTRLSASSSSSPCGLMHPRLPPSSGILTGEDSGGGGGGGGGVGVGVGVGLLDGGVLPCWVGAGV